MKKIDEEGLKLCALQAEVFAASITAMQCSTPIFIRRFMYSEVASRMEMKWMRSMERHPTEKSGTAGRNCIGWDTCIDIGLIPMKKAANRCINK